MFVQPRHDRCRFLGMAALSLGAAWIDTRDSVLHLITVTPFRPSSGSDLASLGGATAWLSRRLDLLPALGVTIAAAAHLALEPRLGEPPVAHDRVGRDVQDCRRLLDRQARQRIAVR
jgi:hypothetical protein